MSGALVASPHFRWRVGLPVLESDAVDGCGVVVGLWPDGGVQVKDNSGWVGVVNPAYLLPVTDDPFFKGWLLHLVREAWGADARVVLYSNDLLRSCSPRMTTTDGPTAYTALVTTPSQSGAPTVRSSCSMSQPRWSRTS